MFIRYISGIYLDYTGYMYIYICIYIVHGYKYLNLWLATYKRRWWMVLARGAGPPRWRAPKQAPWHRPQKNKLMDLEKNDLKKTTVPGSSC